ncbi:hypothetical protein BDP27DRAFT_1176538, partial [Rhodocollybia butyracea]
SAKSVCATCLGISIHQVQNCSLPHLWNGTEVFAQRQGRELSARGTGKPICLYFNLPKGCTDSSHSQKHICSGCGSPSHGAQACIRAE